jgi:NAD(P) transhydrogenase subunit alpha
VRLMKPGSVIVDLAGEAGVSCELSEPGQSVCERNHFRGTSPLKVSGRARWRAGRITRARVRTELVRATGTIGRLGGAGPEGRELDNGYWV